MDAKTYCRNMASEVTAWKAKVYDVMRELDKLEAIEKRPVSQIQNIHDIIDSLENDIDTLKKECPAEWSGAKGTIDQKAQQLKTYWEDLILYTTKEAPYNA